MSAFRVPENASSIRVGRFYKTLMRELNHNSSRSAFQSYRSSLDGLMSTVPPMQRYCPCVICAPRLQSHSTQRPYFYPYAVLPPRNHGLIYYINAGPAIPGASVTPISPTGARIPYTLKTTDRNHGKDRMENPIKCTTCGRTFARVSALQIHLRIHSGEKPFPCRYCPKAFSQSANLAVHLRTHTREKPYPCPVCQKCFSQSSSVATHLRIHTGEKPFECNTCGKRFSDRSTLAKHGRVHGNPTTKNDVPVF